MVMTDPSTEAGSALSAAASGGIAGAAVDEMFVAAVKAGRAAELTRLLAAGAAFGKADPHGRTPLHKACQNDQPAVVAQLIAAGAAIGCMDRHGCTPLHLACFGGAAEVVAQLLAAGAAIDCVDDDGRAPLHIAAAHAAEVMSDLLGVGAPIDGVDDVGRTPLHYASAAGCTAAVAMLIAACAAVDRVDDDGRAPLHAACSSDVEANTAVIEQLLRAGAAINRADRAGCTPLYLASWQGRTAVAARLLAGRAAVDPADDRKCTPLAVACRNGHADVAGVLIAAGAAVNHRLRGGLGPLHVACASGHLECAQLCSAHGARRTRVWLDAGSPTAEDFATHHGHGHVAEWLERSREWTTRLHHLEALTEAQARAELRAGAELHAAARVGGPTPLLLAIALLADADDVAGDEWPGVSAARLVLRAAEPWSPANHELFPVAARARAVELVHIGFLLSRDARFTSGGPQAMMDTWRDCMMPHALHRSTELPLATSDEQPDAMLISRFSARSLRRVRALDRQLREITRQFQSSVHVSRLAGSSVGASAAAPRLRI